MYTHPYMLRHFLSRRILAFVRAYAYALALGISLSSNAIAQNNEIDQIAKANDFVSNRNWSAAEAILIPLTQSQPKNPFIFYDLAQVYENTNRVDLAKQIYQGLTNTLSADSNQYTVVVRAPYASRLVSLVSLAQAKLDAINARPAIVPQRIATIPPSSLTTTAISATSTTTKQTSRSQSLRENHSTVSVAMKSWATAWANKNLTSYYASYTPDFRGEMATRAAWENKRREAIDRETNIEINFKNLEITSLSPTSVQARFLQSYFSDNQSSKARKTLLFTLSNGRWLIERETTK